MFLVMVLLWGVVFLLFYFVYLSFALTIIRGLEIWRIENFKPVRVAKSSFGKFYTGDSYIVLKITLLKSGAFHYDVHYWIGQESTKDEAGAAAILTIELDDSLGGLPIQHREMQGHETDLFLSYFKPCIVPLKGGIASGFKHVKDEEYHPRLYVIEGNHAVRVREIYLHQVPFAKSSLNHGDVFILDTKGKIFRFCGSSSTIRERGKAMEVVQFIKDNHHHGHCDVASIDDGEQLADHTDSVEFWALFGGFGPILDEANDEGPSKDHPVKLFHVVDKHTQPVEAHPLTKELLQTDSCYILDCGFEIFVWMGRSSAVALRKNASLAAEELVHKHGNAKASVVRISEGCETGPFCLRFEGWPVATAQ